MAHLPAAEIQARRGQATQHIIQQWEKVQGATWYAIMCRQLVSYKLTLNKVVFRRLSKLGLLKKK